MGLKDFVDRYRRSHPSMFDTVLWSAAEAELSSLRCEPLGVAAFSLVRTPQGDGKRFEALISERLPLTVFVQHGVEIPQPSPMPTE
jgi:hypothetical protein